MLRQESVIALGAILAGRIPLRLASSLELEGRRHCIFKSKAGIFSFDYSAIPLGAVILTSSWPSVIPVFQRRLFTEPLAFMWTHIGIVGANHDIFDIMPSLHVRHLHMADFLNGANFFAVRALRDVEFTASDIQMHIDDQSSQARYPTLTQAKTLVRFMEMMVAGEPLALGLTKNEYLCSTFVGRILDMATDTQVLEEENPALVLPAHFAISTNFYDVPLVQCLGRMN